MILIPFSTETDTFNLFIGIDDPGIDRIKRYDPATVPISHIPDAYHLKSLKHIYVGYLNADDLKHIHELKDNPEEIFRYLSRGWEFRPDLGDHDGPPTHL